MPMTAQVWQGSRCPLEDTPDRSSRRYPQRGGTLNEIGGSRRVRSPTGESNAILWAVTSSDLPLKVQQPDGTYSCQWSIPDHATGAVLQPLGQIVLGGSKPPRCSVSGPVPGEQWGGFPKRFEYEILCGRLANGAGVVLIEPTVSVMGHPGGFISFPAGNATIFSGVALVGRGAELITDTKITEISVQISHLDYIFRNSPIISRNIPMQSESGELTWSATTRSNNQIWRDGSTSMEVSHMQNATVFAEYEFGVRLTPFIRIKFDEPVEFYDAYDRWVRTLYRVMSVLTGKEEEVTFLEVRPAKWGADGPMLQVFASPVTQSPYMPERGRIPQANDSALKLDEDGISLLDLVKRWQALENEQNPVVYTYEPFALGSNQHPRARFLLLIQALEGISNKENRLQDRQAAFEKKHSRVLNECMKFLTGASRRFVKSNLRNSSINLDDRLRDMFDSLPVDPTKKIAETVLVARVCEEKGLKPEGALRLIRNDLAHGNRTYDFRELGALATVLESVVRAHALRILDLGVDVQARPLDFND